MGSAAFRWLDDFPNELGVQLLDPPHEFESIYASVRQAEGRILSDEEVIRLPQGDGLKHEAEWRVRALGRDRLVQALNTRGLGLHILEVGCGNGWLSAQLHRGGHQVLGIDRFTLELRQAARVFHGGPEFARADLFCDSIPKATFDAIVFAASIPYFPDLPATIRRAKALLRDGGEVHVLESMLYTDEGARSAAESRTMAYYERLGYPEMAKSYRAHRLKDLLAFDAARILHRPERLSRWSRVLGRLASPFTYVVIG